MQRTSVVIVLIYEKYKIRKKYCLPGHTVQSAVAQLQYIVVKSDTWEREIKIGNKNKCFALRSLKFSSGSVWFTYYITFYVALPALPTISAWEWNESPPGNHALVYDGDLLHHCRLQRVECVVGLLVCLRLNHAAAVVFGGIAVV